MQGNSNPITVLIADDDPEDRMLIEDAFEESRLANTLEFVVDGEDLLDYLYRRDGYSDPSASPRPGLILLDLNMPRKDGREALKEIKSDPDLRKIPIGITVDDLAPLLEKLAVSEAIPTRAKAKSRSVPKKTMP